MTPKLAIEGFNVAAVYVDDLEESLDFYTNILGFEKKAEIGGGIQIQLNTENNDIALYLQGGYAKDDREYHVSKISLCFDTPSVKTTFQKAKDLDLPVCLEYQEVGGNYAMFCIFDPSGNQIMFTGNP